MELVNTNCTSELLGHIQFFDKVFKCHDRFNCTGKKQKFNTCGSDGKWYANACTLRFLRCLYNLETLQRDPFFISCKC